MSPTPSRLSRLYSRYLTPEEKRSIRAVPVDDLSSEVKLLRFLSTLFLKFQQSAPNDLASHMQSLRTFSMLSAQLATLVRSIDQLEALLGELNDPLEEALEIEPFDIPPDTYPQEQICPESAAASQRTGTPTNMASIPNISAPPSAEPFPISPLPT